MPVFVNLCLYLPEFVNDELGQIQAITDCTHKHSWANSKIPRFGLIVHFSGDV